MDTLNNKLREAISKALADAGRTYQEMLARAEAFATANFPDLDDLPVQDLYIGSFVWPLYLEFPLDKSLMAEVARRFAAAGWRERNQIVSAGHCNLTFDPPEIQDTTVYVVCRFTLPAEAPTCKIVRVGTKEITHQEPVYEVVCLEG